MSETPAFIDPDDDPTSFAGALSEEAIVGNANYQDPEAAPPTDEAVAAAPHDGLTPGERLNLEGEA